MRSKNRDLKSGTLSIALAILLLAACQPAATSAPETRIPLATRAPVSGGPAEPTAEPLATLESSANGWQTFSSADGGFTLLLPGEPKEQKQPISTAAGSIEAIMYIAEVGNTAFGVGYSDYLKSALSANPQAVLAGARDGAAKNVNGTVVDETPLELDGFPGSEITIDMPDSSSAPGGARYHARIYLVNSRLYQVIYVALKQDENAADYQKLFDSFHLDNPPAPNTPVPTTSTSLKDWIEYRSNEGGYAVLLPAEPKITTQSTDTAAGSVEVTMALVEMGNQAAGAAFNDIPKAAQADPETLLKGGREGAAKNLKGKVVSDKPIKLGNYPGTEFVVDVPNNLIYMARVYVVNDRLYQVMFLAPKDQIDQFDVQGFFDSFQITPKVEQP